MCCTKEGSFGYRAPLIPKKSFARPERKKESLLSICIFSVTSVTQPCAQWQSGQFTKVSGTLLKSMMLLHKASVWTPTSSTVYHESNLFSYAQHVATKLFADQWQFLQFLTWNFWRTYARSGAALLCTGGDEREREQTKFSLTLFIIHTTDMEFSADMIPLLSANTLPSMFVSHMCKLRKFLKTLCTTMWQDRHTRKMQSSDSMQHLTYDRTDVKPFEKWSTFFFLIY